MSHSDPVITDASASSAAPCVFMTQSISGFLGQTPQAYRETVSQAGEKQDKYSKPTWLSSWE